MNYYEILGVSPDATQDDIKKAYRQLSKEYHPDVNQDENATQRFTEINEAYQVLSDPNKRAAYDNPQRTRTIDISDVFEIFGEILNVPGFF